MIDPCGTLPALRAVFEQTGRRGDLALIPYWMAGYPTLDESLRIMRLLARGGADLIEIGIPFSDPVADGATIQMAAHAALERGFRLPDLLAALRAEPLGCPAAIMSYLNPLESHGRERLLDEMTGAGIAGLIIPDLPPEEAGEWLAASGPQGVSLVFLVAPTTTDERLCRISEACDGFIYAVSLTGTTGARRALSDELPAYLARIREMTSQPVAVGFGISEPAHVRSLRGRAAGVVIGSRLIDAVNQGEDLSKVMHAFKEAAQQNCGEQHSC